MKVNVTIPDGLHDITLEQYQRFSKVKGDQEFLSHKMIEIFCHVDLRDVLKLQMKHIEEILSLLNEAFTQKPPLTRIVTLQGKKMGFIPNLLDITLGEYTDMEENISDWDTMHKVMAVLYRPIDQKFKDLYTIAEYEGTAKTAEAMKQMPLDVVFGALNFMLRLGMDLSRATLLSMEMEMEMTSVKSNQPSSSSLNDGDGIHSIMPLLKAMLLALSRYQGSTTASPIPMFPSRLKSTN